MADITMCGNNNCKQRYNCYRYTAVVSEYHQSWFFPEPDGDTCEEFWDNTYKHNRPEITDDNP